MLSITTLGLKKVLNHFRRTIDVMGKNNSDLPAGNTFVLPVIVRTSLKLTEYKATWI